MTHRVSRRGFVAGGAAGAAWLTFGSGALASLAACAREDAAREAPFRNLSDAQGRTLRAFADRLLPAVDGRPGAEEAGAVWFIDRAIAESMPPMREPVLEAARQLDDRASTASFADLAPDAQDALLRTVENEPWFGAVHFLTVCGVFADPTYGGNRGDAGHRLVDMQHATAWQPPFGFYDAEYAAGEETA